MGNNIFWVGILIVYNIGCHDLPSMKGFMSEQIEFGARTGHLARVYTAYTLKSAYGIVKISNVYLMYIRNTRFLARKVLVGFASPGKLLVPWTTETSTPGSPRKTSLYQGGTREMQAGFQWPWTRRLTTPP